VIIDAHTHLLDRGFWPDEWFDHVAEEWAAKAPERTPAHIRERIEDGLADPDGEQMIQSMDLAGIDAAILLPMDWGPTFNTRRSLKEYQDQTLRAAARWPTRLIPFGGVDPRRPDALERISDLIEADSIAGLKLYPAAGWEPLHPTALQLYDLCSRKGLPVLFHTGDPLPILDRQLGGPSLLESVVSEFPELVILAGHAGAPSRWADAIDLAKRHPHVLLEMSVWVWADTSLPNAIEVVRRMVQAADEIGPDRFVFGTDHVSGRKVRGLTAMKTIIELFRTANSSLDESARLSETAMNAFLGETVGKALSGWRHHLAP
jgi:predicted TIM-barrel fold metal-dependent hydrolase